MLGIQGPHHDYASAVTNGMIYSQKIVPADHGFIKSYYLSDGPEIVMSQTIHYRTYAFADALDLLAQYGFTHHANGNLNNGRRQFLEFTKC